MSSPNRDELLGKSRWNVQKRDSACVAFAHQFFDDGKDLIHEGWCNSVNSCEIYDDLAVGRRLVQGTPDLGR